MTYLNMSRDIKLLNDDFDELEGTHQVAGVLFSVHGLSKTEHKLIVHGPQSYHPALVFHIETISNKMLTAQVSV